MSTAPRAAARNGSWRQNPQPLFLRRAMFQIHLWAGVILSLYVAVVGLSGSILVFREELTRLTYPSLVGPADPPAPRVEVETVVANARAAYPRARVLSALLPGQAFGNYAVFAAEGPRQVIILADPATGRILGSIDRTGSWITWMQQLHFYLLLGEPGIVINGIGGLLLVALCGTGLVIWWPGVKHWVRALGVNLRAGWKRVNWDLHSAIGFWTLLIVAMWGATGAYFPFARPFAAFVNRFSPVTNALPPRIKVPAPPPGARPAPLAALIGQAARQYPAARLAGVQFPAQPAQPLTIQMARAEIGNTRATNYVYFDPYRATLLGTWERGVNRTWGDAIVFLMGPLHFGVYWGMTVKILWAGLGLALPVLALTGLLMYWNRWLGKRWRGAFRRRRAAAAARTE